MIVDLDAPLTPQKSYKDESGEANDDQYALVVVKPFTLKANTDGNTNDRILVTLRGTGKDIHTGEAERITQTLVLTSDSDMEFSAGHFRAVSLQLENDWTPSMCSLPRLSLLPEIMRTEPVSCLISEANVSGSMH